MIKQFEKQQQKKQKYCYFDLITYAGTWGKYQIIILILFAILSMLTGSMSLGTSYYFAIAPYNKCDNNLHGYQKCNQYVCSLPLSQRKQYQDNKISQLKTLGNQYGDYHCQNSDTISFSKGMFFIGTIVGYIIVGLVSDNLGRRISVLGCTIISLIGVSSIVFIRSLHAANFGLFLLGFGLENCINLAFYFFSQTMQNTHRQKAGVIYQASFCIGGLLMIMNFYIFKNWKIIFVLFLLLPIVLCLIIALYYLKQTPQYLIKRHQIQHIVNIVKQISQLNNKNIQNQDQLKKCIQKLKQQYEEQRKKQKHIYTYLDLFKYQSLRYLTISVCFVIFSVDFLYYGPTLLLDTFGFDFYVNGVIINISQLITYIFTYYFITKIQRKKIGIVLMSVALGCCFCLIFLNKKQICTNNCWSFKTVIQLIIVFVFRFVVSLQFQILLIYINELYPTQIVGVGFGFASIVGTIPNTILPEIVNKLQNSNFSIMILFCIIAVVGIIFSSLIRQTYGQPPCQKIQHNERKDEMQLIEQVS